MTARNSPQFLPASGVYFPGAYASMVSALSMAEKQKILYRAAQGLDGGQEVLESWTRKDLLELICLEMGKERKYTGVSKGKMIEQLLKLVAKKGVGEAARNRGGDGDKANGDGNGDGIEEVSSEGRVKKHRKVGRPARVPAMDMARETSPPLSPGPSIDTDMASVQVVEAPASTVCRNTACKALLLPGESFCIRCSCFICRSFDDNKDPSLWIFCTPEPGLSSVDCRLSCHIECALKDGIAGVGQVAAAAASSSSNASPSLPDLDASFRCPSCGKHSSLIGCCKKQLSVAKDARRVDMLCQRLSLCRRLLAGTRKHKEFHELVEKAIQKLEDEIGPVMEGSSKFVRGLVNRLSSSREVLKLIRCALEAPDAVHEVEAEAERRSMIAPSVDEEKSSDLPSVVGEKKSSDEHCTIEIKKVTSSSIVVSVKGGGELATGYRVWHRRATEASYPNNPTCIISSNPGEAQIADVQPSTEYRLYAVPFSERGIGEPSEALCQTLKHGAAEHGASLLQEGRAAMDECGPSDFKVRALGKMVGGEGRDLLEAVREIFQGSKRGRDSESPQDEDREASVAGGPELTQAAEESGITASQTAQADKNAASIEGGSVDAMSESWAVQVRTTPSPTATVSASAGGLILTQKRHGPLLCASRNYEVCVRIVRWLECQGHLAEDFRMKFLTWLSLHASEHEKRVVGVFIDALQDDPASLAAQLVHTFSDAVSSKHRLPCNAFRHDPSWH